MTEIAVEFEASDKILFWPFLAALVAAPLTIGLPALALTVIAANLPSTSLEIAMVSMFFIVATCLGLPTYLVFGGPAFWVSIRKNYQIPIVAFVANLASLPAIATAAAVTSGDVLIAVAIYAILGSAFAPLWGAIVARLYARFSREWNDA